MFGWIRKFFKKKEKNEKKIPKTSFSKYKIRLNARTLCFYERMTEKTAFKIGAEDILEIMYASLVCNNDLKITYEGFIQLLESEPKLAKWLIMKYEEINKMESMAKGSSDEGKASESKDDMDYPMMRDVVAKMIAVYHIDPTYVMNEMEIWEIEKYIGAYEKNRQDELEEARLWTYIGILPQVDGKKLRGPEDIITFPWEKTRKERAKEDLDKMTKSVIATLNFYNKKKEEDKKEEKKEDNG